MLFRSLLRLVLNLFDGGGGGEGTAGTPGEAQASPAPTQRGKKSGESVLYGKQPEGAQQSADAGQAKEQGVTTTSDTLEARRQEYRDLIDSKYRDIHDEEFQTAFNRRFRAMKGMQEQLEAQKPVIEAMCAKYGVTGNDMGKLMQAVNADDSFLADAAEEAGMTVDQFREHQRILRENAELRMAQENQQLRERTNRQLSQWQAEAEQMKKLYPHFDLGTEAGNPQFLSLLKSGVPVQTAYEVLHMNEIKAGVAASQAAATEKQITASIRAKGSRPKENGTSSQGTFVVKDDVNKLTAKDRAEIARRVQRGEVISF